VCFAAGAPADADVGPLAALRPPPAAGCARCCCCCCSCWAEAAAACFLRGLAAMEVGGAGMAGLAWYLWSCKHVFEEQVNILREE
jgi:hypothetical protein